MRRSFGIGILAIAGLSALVISASSAAPPARTLTGQMTQLQYLVGTWHCTIAVSAQGKMAAHTDVGTLLFDVEPSNTVGYYISSGPYAAGGFYGWVASKQLWYVSGADNFGGTSFETGSGSGGLMMMTGSTTMQSRTMTTRDKYTKASATKIGDLSQYLKAGRWLTSYNSTCTKTSNKSM